MTAVEFLEEIASKGFISPENFKEAKEMEKKLIKKAWVDGNYNTDSNGNPSENYAISDDRYYQKTFKNK